MGISPCIIVYYIYQFVAQQQPYEHPKHLPLDSVTNTNISSLLTQQPLTANQINAGRLTCGQLGANACICLERALCASCIINNVGRLTGQELSCSQRAEPYHPLCCSILQNIIQLSLEK